MIEKKIYLVGGAIRDKLLGQSAYDKDYVAVGYEESEFSHLQRVGKDFPVFLKEDGSELALARVEKKVAEGYNGFEMSTRDVSLEDDLKRRDLTINSIAYDEENDIYIDPYNGQSDIQRKILRHTSDAFIEDPMRVLRLARFRAKYGYTWKIHASTKVFVYQMRDELKHLQADRVYREIEKVLDLDNSYIFFETLFELGILDVIFPNIYTLTTLKEGSVYHMESSVFEHTMMILKLLSKSSRLLKLTALYHDIAKPYCYRTYGNSAHHDKKEIVEPLIDMKLPSKLQKKMLVLIENHIKVYILDHMKVTKRATFFEGFKKDRELLEDMITFADADNEGRICLVDKLKLPREKLLYILDEILKYSPKEWIDTQEHITPDMIKQHIHKYNICVVQKHWK